MKLQLENAWHFLRAFLRWSLLAILVGAVCGLVGTAFHVCVNFATQWRGELAWLLYLLPVGGVVIVWLYHRLGQSSSLGTDKLFTSIQDRTAVPVAMAPLIFVATFLTHLLGGSAGREGAALQLGGSLGSDIGRLLKLNEDDRRTLTMVGMGALFAALFGTPLTATLFVMEVLCMGHMVYSSFVPCIVASLTAFGVSLLLHMEPEGYVLAAVPGLNWLSALQVTGLAALCAALSVIFCAVMHISGHSFKKWMKNPYVRAIAGGAAIIALTLLVGTRDYNGAGAQVIERAIEGEARPWDFVLKLVFTAITLGCGYKGGEIVPTFFVGATFGCVVGPLLGLDPGFAAAIALVATFCGNTNCPVASVFLGIELFGGQAVPLFALACAVSYMLSGYSSLYHNQLIPEKELKFGDMVTPEKE
ncbi:MAG: chloride channel protein [Eubacteriales bacterium]|nr:chloride channel protein [Eubacteriales bacterium]